MCFLHNKCKKTKLALSANTLATDEKSQLTGKDPDAGRDREQENGVTDDEST